MTGSVHNDTHKVQSPPAQTEKSDKSLPAPKKTQQSLPRTRVVTGKDASPVHNRSSSNRRRYSLQLPDKKNHSYSSLSLRRISSSPVGSNAASPSNLTRMNLGTAHLTPLSRRGRARSTLTLFSTEFDPILEMDNFPSGGGTKSEVGGYLSPPHVGSHRGYRRDGGSHSFGTLERATSYSSLATRTGTLFRSANSPRPLPAPPCTTADQDPCRHVAPPLAVQAKSQRLSGPTSPPHAVGGGIGGTPLRSNPQCVNGTPRACNPQLVPHTQNTYSKERKTYEQWSYNAGQVGGTLPHSYRYRGDSVSGRKRATTLHMQRGQLELHGSMDNVFSSASTPHRLQPNPPNYTMKRYASTHSLLPTTMGAVSNALAERRVRLHVPRGHKMESLI